MERDELLALFDIQLFVASKERAERYKTAGKPQADAIRPLDTEGVEWNGKPYGGFWTSTRLSRGYSDWVAWCRAEMPHWLGDRWALSVAPDARVLHVYTRADAEQLPTVTRRNSYGIEKQYIDYDTLARSYDGLHFGDSDAVWKYSRDVDVESTLWFRWAFDRVWLDMGGVAIQRRGENRYRTGRYGVRYENWHPRTRQLVTV